MRYCYEGYLINCWQTLEKLHYVHIFLIDIGQNTIVMLLPCIYSPYIGIGQNTIVMLLPCIYSPYIGIGQNTIVMLLPCIYSPYIGIGQNNIVVFKCTMCIYWDTYTPVQVQF